MDDISKLIALVKEEDSEILSYKGKMLEDETIINCPFIPQLMTGGDIDPSYTFKESHEEQYYDSSSMILYTKNNGEWVVE